MAARDDELDKSGEHLPNGWEILQDQNGQTYYYNRALEVASADRPQPSSRTTSRDDARTSGSSVTEEEDEDDVVAGFQLKGVEIHRRLQHDYSASEPNSPPGGFQKGIVTKRLQGSATRTTSLRQLEEKGSRSHTRSLTASLAGSLDMPPSLSAPTSPDINSPKRDRKQSSLSKILFKKKDKSDNRDEGGEERSAEAEEWIKSGEAIREKKWDTAPSADQVDARSLTLLDIGCITYGFNPEYGRADTPADQTFELEEKAKHTNYYQTLFSQAEHFNFVGTDEILGPIVVTIQSPTAIPADQKNFFVIVRTKKGDERKAVPRLPNIDSPEAAIKWLRIQESSLHNVKFTRVTEPRDQQSLITSLLSYEKQLIQKNYKFGVLYVKEGQTEENQYFNNVEHSAGFQEFLSVIADEVPLRGFTQFAGGLDCKSDSTGVRSFHTTFQNIQIMLHVSTLLPYFPKDVQQVERKRHLGNDIVIIIYKEGSGGGKAFDPRVVASQFNHVFAVVQAEGNQYRVCFANKFGVKPYSPLVPLPCLFDKGPQFKQFLLTKLINGERAAMYAPDFRSTLTKTREVLLRSMVEKYSVVQSKGLMKMFKKDSGSALSRKPSSNRLTMSTDG